jgi:aldose 1-epimerase
MTKSETLNGIKRKDFQTVIDGKSVDLYILTNKNGAEVSITNFGGIVVTLIVHDKSDKLIDVVAGKNNIVEYQNNFQQYFGAIIGRVSSRIAGGVYKFV